MFKNPYAVRGAKRLLNMSGVVSLAEGFAVERKEIGAVHWFAEPGRGGHRVPEARCGVRRRGRGVSGESTAAPRPAATGLDLAFLTGVEGVTELILVRHGEQEVDHRAATVGDVVRSAAQRPWR